MPDRTEPKAAGVNAAEAKTGVKSEETRDRILNAALTLFRKKGFEAATMRDIAEEAGVATGAAYYYFSSKEAIVMEYYRRSCVEMQPKIEAALKGAKDLETRLRELIRVKLAHFSPNRGVLRALLRNGADPKHPLSPFSSQTKEVRDIDIAWFRGILTDCGVRIPKDLEQHLPGVLWFFQMGVIFFWVIDESLGQARSDRLLGRATKSVTSLIRVSALPLMRPVRKTAMELVDIVKGRNCNTPYPPRSGPRMPTEISRSATDPTWPIDEYTPPLIARGKESPTKLAGRKTSGLRVRLPRFLSADGPDRDGPADGRDRGDARTHGAGGV